MSSTAASPSALPEPSPDAQAHSELVVSRIHAEIAAAGGWISFSRFMELVLYAPGLGYYSAGSQKFGAAGDFVTAPELSPLFARCLARQCVEIQSYLRGRDIFELGAGSGALAADLLAELARLGAPPTRYLILERSADLRQRQRACLTERIPDLAERVVWLDSLPAFRSVTGVVLANEVLDALPVDRFRIVASGHRLMSLGVGLRDGCLCAEQAAAPPAMHSQISRIERALGHGLPDGYESEWCPGLGHWIAAIGDVLAEGLILFSDYGLGRREYYLSERSMGTLLCHYRHRVHADPFLLPGLQDITAWVDFTAVAEAASAAALELHGYTSQANFLIGTGLAELLAHDADRSETQRLEAARQAKYLMLPGEMGEAYKVIALSRGLDAPLQGFAIRDLSHSL